MTVNKKQKHKKDKKSSNTPTRYYDQRLLWLFFLLAGLFLSVRVVVCQHFHVPFLNGIAPDSPDGNDLIGHSEYNQLEGIIALVEMFVAMIASALCINESKNKNSRNDGTEKKSTLMWLWLLAIMALPFIITYCWIYCWYAYSLVMLPLSFIIGKYDGFTSPLFHNVGKNFWYGCKDVTVKLRTGGTVFLPGHTSVLLMIVCFAILFFLLFYNLREAW